MTIVAAVIDKKRHDEKYRAPMNPYHLALRFGLERLAMFLAEEGDTGAMHVIFESRGRVEDGQLSEEFVRITSGENKMKQRLAMQPVFADKRANHSGLQLADMVARPIARHILNPDQDNRAFDILEPKMRRSPKGEIKGYGLKVFP